MNMFTVEHRTFIVKKFQELKCSVKVRRAFRREFTGFHGKNLPSLKFIRRGHEVYKTTAALKRSITHVFRKFSHRKFDFIPQSVRERWDLYVAHKGYRW